MKKKHEIKIIEEIKYCEIKTIEDIKYCEENGLRIYSKMNGYYFEFLNGIWSEYDENDSLIAYQVSLFVSDNLYYYDYYEEQKQQEATEEDVGKLCRFWDNNESGIYTILKAVYCDRDTRSYETEEGLEFLHCCRLTASEVAELTGYKVEALK